VVGGGVNDVQRGKSGNLLAPASLVSLTSAMSFEDERGP
jgi:hypothetical protein